MSGHSKWATTKRKKAKIDSARAKVFNRVNREITIAAKMGGSDINGNPRLRNAVLKAKAVNMPSKNIETAIAKGSNELEGVVYSEPVYEGYGPDGISILVDCMTDNKTRTVADIRHIFNKFGGNLGTEGSVAWMFKTKGVITLTSDAINEEELLDIIIEAGADDLQTSDGEYEITMDPNNFQSVLEALSARGLETLSAEITKIAESKKCVSGDKATIALKLLEALDDNDDVQNVSTNADFDDKDLGES